MKTFKEFIEEYKVGDKVTYHNIKTKRKKTNKVRKVYKDQHGQTKYEMDNGKIVYHSDLD